MLVDNCLIERLTTGLANCRAPLEYLQPETKYYSYGLHNV